MKPYESKKTKDWTDADIDEFMADMKATAEAAKEMLDQWKAHRKKKLN